MDGICSILSTLVSVSVKLLVFAIPIAEIVIGALYLDSCPIQRYIPIYLVVTGVFTLCLVLFITLSPCTDDDIICGICVWNLIVFLFLCCWVIAGSVWIYPIYQPNYNPDAGPYCDKTVYMFAFWMTTLTYIGTAVGIVVCCVSIVLCVKCGIPFLGKTLLDHFMPRTRGE